MTKIETENQMQALAGIAIPRCQLAEAVQAAVLRGRPPAQILHAEYDVPRKVILTTLSTYYQCAAIEYDERLPIPPELLTGLQDKLIPNGWFPVIKDADGTIVIAAVNPSDEAMQAEVKGVFGPAPFEFRVALPDDIAWFTQDFLHDKPGRLIGTERTNLAFWRNTMAQWRTRLACYRTDLAQARTALAFVRAGLAHGAISRIFLNSQHFATHPYLIYGALILNLLLFFGALPTYLRVRRSRMTPPQHHTLVEVSSATLSFLEEFQNEKHAEPEKRIKETMLARLGDLLGNYCTILHPSPASRERTHLARERNVLAAQRTIAGCYRTIYSRARTGLAFIRTGVSFVSIGIGLIAYFGLGFKTIFDAMLIVIGLLMIIDGGLWYLPVRKEQAELPGTRGALPAGGKPDENRA